MPGYANPPKNFLILWLELAAEKLAANMNARKKAFRDAADAAITAASGYTVRLRIASGVDVFSEVKGNRRVSYVALFEVVLDPLPAATTSSAL